jgi:lysophospholipase L1-like esterase
MATAPATADRVAYAALGASETYGVGATAVGRSYPYRIRDALGLPAGDFADVGIPGATVGDAYQTELTSALAIEPTTCTVFFGVNDVRRTIPLPQFVSDLTDLTTTLRRARCRVLIIGLPNLVDLPALRTLPASVLSATTQQWNAAIRQVATSTGAAFLPLDSLSAELAAHPEEVAPDGLHPSNSGHARLAEVILTALRSNGLIPR